METLQEIFERNKNAYREIVADIDGFSASEKDEAIKIIFFNLQAFIEHAWGNHSVQLALCEKLKSASQKAFEYDTMTPLAIAELVDLKIEGAFISPEQSLSKEDLTP